MSTSVTGIAAPSVEARLARRLGLRPDVNACRCSASAASRARPASPGSTTTSPATRRRRRPAVHRTVLPHPSARRHLRGRDRGRRALRRRRRRPSRSVGRATAARTAPGPPWPPPAAASTRVPPPCWAGTSATAVSASSSAPNCRTWYGCRWPRRSATSSPDTTSSRRTSPPGSATPAAPRCSTRWRRHSACPPTPWRAPAVRSPRSATSPPRPSCTSSPTSWHAAGRRPARSACCSPSARACLRTRPSALVVVNPYAVLIVLVAVERLAELRTARRNAAWSRARGGVEHGARPLSGDGRPAQGAAGRLPGRSRPYRPSVHPLARPADARRGPRRPGAALVVRQHAGPPLEHPGHRRPRTAPGPPWSLPRPEPPQLRRRRRRGHRPAPRARRLADRRPFTLANAWLLAVRLRCENTALTGCGDAGAGSAPAGQDPAAAAGRTA